MARKKVRLQFIPNDAERRASFKKRRKGLMKKVHELSTLCGVDACAIVFGPSDNEPEVWPSSLGVQRVLAKFRRLPQFMQGNRMTNQETFTKERIRKLEEKWRKLQQENRVKEMTEAMSQCLGGEGLTRFNMADLNDMDYVLDKNVKEISKKVAEIKRGTNNVPQGPRTVIQGSGSNAADTSVASEMMPVYNECAGMKMNNYSSYSSALLGPPCVQPGLGLWEENQYQYNSSFIDAPSPTFFYP